MDTQQLDQAIKVMQLRKLVRDRSVSCKMFLALEEALNSNSLSRSELQYNADQLLSGELIGSANYLLNYAQYVGLPIFLGMEPVLDENENPGVRFIDNAITTECDGIVVAVHCNSMIAQDLLEAVEGVLRRYQHDDSGRPHRLTCPNCQSKNLTHLTRNVSYKCDDCGYRFSSTPFAG